MICPHKLFFIIALVSTLQCALPLTVLARSAGKQQVQTHGQTQQPPPAATQQAEAEATELIKEVYVLYRQGRFDEALPKAERALSILEKAGERDSAGVGAVLNVIGLIHHGRGTYALAEEPLSRSLVIFQKRLGPKHFNTIQALKILALVHLATGDYARAEPLLLQVLEIQKEVNPSPPDAAGSLANLAWLHRRKGEFARAESLYQQALSLLENYKGASDEPPAYALTLASLADLYQEQGDYRNAEKLYQRSLALQEQALGDKHPFIASALYNMAELAHTTGDYSRAEQLFRRALELQQQRLGARHPSVLNTLNGLGMLYRSTGDYARAEESLLQAIDIGKGSLGVDHPNLAAPLNNLATIYRERGDYGRAEETLNSSRALLEKSIGPEHHLVANVLDNLANLHLEQGRGEAAEPLFRRSLAMREKAFKRSHPSVASSMNNLAGLHLIGGKYAEADVLYRQAREIIEKTLGDRHPLAATSLINLAGLKLAQGDTASAISLFARGNEIRESHLEAILGAGAEEQKRLFLATLNGETSAALHLNIAAAPSDPAATRLALTAVLQRKGRTLDAVASQTGALRRRLDPRAAELFDSLLTTRSKLAALVLRNAVGADPAAYQSEVGRLRAEEQRLGAAISELSAEYRTGAQPITIEGVQRALAPGTALVEFASYRRVNVKSVTPAGRYGSERYAAFVLAGEGAPRVVDIGEADAVNAAVEELRRALRDPRRADVKQVARALDEKVIAPVRRLLAGARTIFISPDGALNLIPFGALVGGDGRYLIENHTLTYLTSGRDLLRLQTHFPSRQPPVVVANPDYDWVGTYGDSKGVTDGPASGLPDRFAPTFAPLSGTAEEAATIARLLEVKPLTGSAATEAALKAVRGPTILHLSTHGFFHKTVGERGRGEGWQAARGPSPPASGVLDSQREMSLLRSGLALAGVNTRRGGIGDDGMLTALEISAIDLWGTKLAVLSACETGLGDVVSGEGVYGLRRALGLAGAESQVISLWKVSDDATRDIMTAYYKRLKAGDGRSEALRQVQLQLLRSSDQQHPYFWASFIPSGDWKNLGGK